MTEEKAKELGVKPMATFIAGALGGVRPEIMGVGPVASTKKVFAKTGLIIEPCGVPYSLVIYLPFRLINTVLPFGSLML